MRRKRKLITAYLLMFLLLFGSWLPFNTGMLPEALSVYAADGDPPSPAPPVFDPVKDYGKYSGSFTKADFDGDGKDDFVTTHENTGQIYFLKGNGDGTFKEPVTTQTDEHAVSPCAGYFNEDKKMDIALVKDSVIIEMGKGDGTFEKTTYCPVGTSPSRVVAADVNNDTYLDLIVSNFHSNDISILTGNGDGTFDEQKTYQAGETLTNIGPSSMAVSDYNNDELPDIAVVNYYAESFSILLNRSADGMVDFSSPTVYKLQRTGDPYASKNISSIIAGDLVGNDKITDLAVTAYLKGDILEGHLYIYKGIGNGKFDEANRLDLFAGPMAGDIALGDFNDDGQQDIAVTHSYNSKVGIFTGMNGEYKWDPSYYTVGSSPSQIIADDFNGDGLDDIATANRNGGVSILLQKGTADDDGNHPCALGCGTLVKNGGFSGKTEINGETYYNVENEQQLAHIKKHLHNNFIQTKTFALKGDWEPIGGFDGSGYFSGNYLATGGAMITDMTIRHEGAGDIYAGLFASVSEGSHIEGIKLIYKSVDIANTDIEKFGDLFFGGIAAQHVSLLTIENCTVTFGSIRLVNQNGDIYCGGIAGWNEGKISGCLTFNGAEEITIGTPKTAFVGGIAGNSGGYTGGYLFNCDHTGPMLVATDETSRIGTIYLGGIVGCLNSEDSPQAVVIENCQNNGDIGNKEAVRTGALEDEENTKRAMVGGIAGYIMQDPRMPGLSAQEGSSEKTIILNCANIDTSGKVEAWAENVMTGGIAGGGFLADSVSSEIRNCYNWSDILSHCQGFAAASGGIVGGAAGVNILSSYSSAESVSAVPVYTVNPDTLVGTMVNKIYDVSPDTCFAGGIIGLDWNGAFSKDFYKNEAVPIGVGGEIADDIKYRQAAFDTSTILDEYIIERLEADPKGIVGATASDLKRISTYGTDEWKWYAGGGTDPQYYSADSPWRFLGDNTYPVLRGKIETPKPPEPPADPGHKHSGGGSLDLITVTFKANDGSDKTVVQKTVTKNGTVSLPEEPDRKGYTFIGWNKKTDGGGYTFTAMTKVSKSLEVYAQWEKNESVEAAQTSKYFSDMAGAKWAIHDVDLLHEKEVVYGVGDNLFKPNSDITRADFMTMLVRAYGLNVEFSDNFADVSQGKYYYEAVGIAKELGIAKGDGNNFRPNDPITRQEAMTLAQRTLDTIGFSLDPGTESDLVGFADAADVASYARIPVATLVKSGIVVGEDGKIPPLDLTTRAEMSAILYRMLNLQ